MSKSLKSVEEIAEMAQIHANSRRFHRQATGAEKKKYRNSTMDGVTNSAAASLLGVSKRTIQRYRVTPMTCNGWKEMFKHETLTDEETDMEEGLTEEDGEYGARNVKKLVNDTYIEIFNDNTGVQSGSIRETRTLAIAKYKLFVRLLAVLPARLRQLHHSLTPKPTRQVA
jgi:hypothetical protein